MKTELTIKQSQRLIELGVSRDIASETAIYDEPCHRAYYAVFTISDLLKILPKEIKHDTTTYHFNIDYPPIEQVAARYITEDNDLDSLYGAMCDELIDALYNLVVWCITNKYLNNESLD